MVSKIFMKNWHLLTLIIHNNWHRCTQKYISYPVYPAILAIYYPPRDVFALNTGKYRPGCIFFVHTGAPVLWIMSGNNFRFFNNISESM